MPRRDIVTASAGVSFRGERRTGALREITLDPGRDRVRVGPGVRCDDLMAAISPHGLAASVGSARDVSAVGYAVFGGVGVLGRVLRFAAHRVLAADVVTADGTRLRRRHSGDRAVSPGYRELLAMQFRP